LSLQLNIWLMSGAIGAVSGVSSSWRLGPWWFFGGLVFGFASGLASAFICSFPYVMLLIYVQKNVPRIESLMIKVLYIPHVILGMLAAWLLPLWCITSIAGAFTRPGY
jgi:hypothetical protein